ncbi:hypothetical protein [Vibrio penaeicida]|uniref:hypothetical protein n=1 Tax=Vibrio penaeicida TaxID=104609 RepID=UPI00142E3AD2|nr:hypothetical protein [Vibrio penaeicida]
MVGVIRPLTQSSKLQDHWAWAGYSLDVSEQVLAALVKDTAESTAPTARYMLDSFIS